MNEPIRLDSLRKLHEHGYAVSASCRECQRWTWIDLPALIAEGRADGDLMKVRVVCKVCGQPGQTSIVWRR